MHRPFELGKFQAFAEPLANAYPMPQVQPILLEYSYLDQ